MGIIIRRTTYYGVNFEDVFQDEGVARNFIYNYFKGGSKLYALDTWANSMNEYLQMRNVHTVNVFFIGAYLQRIIDEHIAIKSEVSLHYPFSYILYLLCLAHDFGYVYENYSKVYLELPSKQHYHRRYYKSMRGPKFWTRKRWYQEHGIDIAYLHPPFGTRSNIAYYNRSTTGKFGSVGADEFFSRLVVNYVKEYRVMAAGDFFRESIYEFHNQRELHFCSEQIKLFAYIADCIASHNMYKADDDERRVAKYLDYSLNCLLSDEFEPISYKDNPLLFILCVADTIEPSKRFPDYRYGDVLNLISIEYSLRDNFLYAEIDEELYDSEAGHR